MCILAITMNIFLNIDPNIECSFINVKKIFKFLEILVFAQLHDVIVSYCYLLLFIQLITRNLVNYINRL